MKTNLLSRRDVLKKIGIISAAAPMISFIINETLSPSLICDIHDLNDKTCPISDNQYHGKKNNKGWISIYCSNIS